jgi:hypothetical protein
MVSISMEALKFLVLINGGAAVAIIALLGNIYASGRPVPDLGCPMILFALALVICGVSFASAYFTQLQLLTEIGTEKAPRHAYPLYTTVALFFISLVLFAVGAVTAVSSFG